MSAVRGSDGESGAKPRTRLESPEPLRRLRREPERGGAAWVNPNSRPFGTQRRWHGLEAPDLLLGVAEIEPAHCDPELVTRPAATGE
jgi:hypothetical protein